MSLVQSITVIIINNFWVGEGKQTRISVDLLNGSPNIESIKEPNGFSFISDVNCYLATAEKKNHSDSVSQKRIHYRA